MAVQPRPPQPETLGEQQLKEVLTAPPPPPPPVNGGVVELLGRRTDSITPTGAQVAFESALEAAVLPHQLHEIDNVVEIAHLQELTAEKDNRIALLTLGISQWRERAIAEADARRREQHAGHERERDLIRVIHQQLSTVDSAEQSAQRGQNRVRYLEEKIDELELRLQLQQQQRRSHWWRRAG